VTFAGDKILSLATIAYLSSQDIPQQPMNVEGVRSQVERPLMAPEQDVILSGTRAME
jgi:hypothetical protein